MLERAGLDIEDIVFAPEDTVADIHFNLESGCEYTPDFVLEYEGYSVGISLIDAEERIAEVVPIERNPEDNSLAAALVLPNLTSRIIYRDILPGIDLEYVIHGHDIKENIIVNHLLESHTFYFELDLEGLRPVHNEDGSISLVSQDTGDEIFLIPAPFMFDANNVFSTAVQYQIVPAGSFWDENADLLPEEDIVMPEEEAAVAEDAEVPVAEDDEIAFTEDDEQEQRDNSNVVPEEDSQTEGEATEAEYADYEMELFSFQDVEAWDLENEGVEGRYLFVVIADEDWMNDPERAFPVVVDPPIIVQRTNTNISTAFVRHNRPTVTAGLNENLFFGYSDSRVAANMC